MVFRRDLLRTTAGASLVGIVGGITNISPVSLAKADEHNSVDQGKPFDQTTVRQLAKSMAQRAYKAPDDHLPDEILMDLGELNSAMKELYGIMKI